VVTSPKKTESAKRNSSASTAVVVGAINILARGHRMLACGEVVSRAKVARPKHAASKKQEPTEATLAWLRTQR
jgi:hypothetical protein